MKTFYKPTQKEGKRIIYASIDPAEIKRRERMERFMPFIIFGVVLVIIVWQVGAKFFGW